MTLPLASGTTATQAYAAATAQMRTDVSLDEESSKRCGSDPPIKHTKRTNIITILDITLIQSLEVVCSPPVGARESRKGLTCSLRYQSDHCASMTDQNLKTLESTCIPNANRAVLITCQAHNFEGLCTPSNLNLKWTIEVLFKQRQRQHNSI